MSAKTILDVFYDRLTFLIQNHATEKFVKLYELHEYPPLIPHNNNFVNAFQYAHDANAAKIFKYMMK